MKRGRPKKGSIDVLPRKKQDIKAQNDPFIINIVNPSHEIVSDYSYVHESILKPLGDASESMLMSENKEILLNYTSARVLMDRSSMFIDDVFAYSVA